METVSKKLMRPRGAALMYVMMAITVVAAIGISITLVATNLFSRTAAKSSDQQAYLLAKSIGQSFVAEDQYVRQIVQHLTSHPDDKVTAKATVYYDPTTMSTVTNVNTQYLTGLSVTDAYMVFHLSEDSNYLYGDVTVTYNGATSVATVVLTCINLAGFDQNMEDLFNYYKMYSTTPNGLKFNYKPMAQSGGTAAPSAKAYNGTNDSDDYAVFTLEEDMSGIITLEGPYEVVGSGTVRSINEKLTAYGNLLISNNITLPYLAGRGLYVNGDLTIGQSGKLSTVHVNRDVYCLSSVYAYSLSSDTSQIVTGNIYAKGSVNLQYVRVSDVYSTSGTIRIRGGTVKNISTQGSVELIDCTVTGYVHAGNLKLTNSSVAGNISVQGSSIVTEESILPKGNAEIILKSDAAGGITLGSTAGNNIYVSGDLKIANYSSSQSLTVKGTVEVDGGLKDPTTLDVSKNVVYPYLVGIGGNLLVHGGIKTTFTDDEVGDAVYNLAYLIGLRVAGDVVLDWSVPTFLVPKNNSLINAYATGITLLDSATRATRIDGSLFVCTSAHKTDGLAGHFAYYKNNGQYRDVCLNNATLGNVFVGCSSSYAAGASYGDLRVWGGTITGDVLAHDIYFADVTTTAATQNFLAKTSEGKDPDVKLGAIYTASGLKRNSCYYSAPAVSVQQTVNAAPTTVILGVLDSAGKLRIHIGACIAASARVACNGNLDIDGVCRGRVVVGNSVSRISEATVSGSAVLEGAEDGVHEIHVNGILYVQPCSSPYTQTAVAYVRPYAYFFYYNEDPSYYHFKTIYEYDATRPHISVSAQLKPYYDSICVYRPAAMSSGSGDIELTKPYTVVYDSALVGSMTDTDTVHYVEVSSLSGGVGFTGTDPSAVLYISCNATISGNVSTAGHVLVRNGVTLSFLRNLTCLTAQNVAATDACVSNPSLLAGTYVDDAAGNTASIQYLSVSGGTHITAEQANITLGDRGRYAKVIIATTGTVRVNDCVFTNQFSAANADKLYVTGGCSFSPSSNMCLICKTLFAEDSYLDMSIYATGDLVQLKNCTVDSVYAKRARVDARNCQFPTGTNWNSNVVAMQLVVESPVGLEASYSPHGDVYLIMGDDSRFTYAPSASKTLFVQDSNVDFLTGSSFSKATLYYYGVVHFTGLPGSVTPVELTDEDDRYAAILSKIDKLCTPTTVSTPSDYIISTADAVSAYDKVSHGTVSMVAPSGIPDTSKAPYKELDTINEMNLGYQDIWNPQASPLEWVFPAGDLEYINAYDGTDNWVYMRNIAQTVAEEPVDLGSNYMADNVMQVAQNALTIGTTVGVYGNALGTLLKGIVEGFKHGFNFSEVKEYIQGDLFKVSSITSWAGISHNYDENYKYSISNYANVAAARGDADILVTSVEYASGKYNLYDAIIAIGNFFGYNLADKISSSAKAELTGIQFPEVKLVWNPLPSLFWDWKYVYRPCGLFFFNSGFVPPTIFNSYTDATHTSWYSYNSEDFRNDDDPANVGFSKARDTQGRWYWGGGTDQFSANGGHFSAKAADCSWTFFTCTDPANPYTSAAKDLHIVLPAHTYFTWLGDPDNTVHIIGNGRVFIYLQEDTNIRFTGRHDSTFGIVTDGAETFGGVRWVQVQDGKSVYKYSNGRPISNYFAETSSGSGYVYSGDNPNSKTAATFGASGTAKRELQPRLFFIGTGPHINVEIEDFRVAAYVYMPNGALYDDSNLKNKLPGWTDSKRDELMYNRFNIYTSDYVAEGQSDVWGIYVADELSTSGAAASSVRFWTTAVDLSDTTIYYNASQVTPVRTLNKNLRYYRLSEFWRYPDNMPKADMHWYYKGIAVG